MRLLLLLTFTFFALKPGSLQAEAWEGGEASFEKLVLLQLNRVRSDPTAYAQFLTGLREHYSADGSYTRPGQIRVRTREGVAAVDEAIRALRKATPVLQLAASEPLASVAKDYAAEQSRSGATGHGGNPFGRISRRGTWLESVGENIAYGSTTPESVVAALIIDDGERSRGHRANILNGTFHVAGVGVNRHPKYGVVCVIDFAGGFNPR